MPDITQGVDHIESRYILESEIDNNDIKLISFRGFDAFGSGTDRRHLKSFTPKHELEDLTCPFVVIDDQHRGRPADDRPIVSRGEGNVLVAPMLRIPSRQQRRVPHDRVLGLKRRVNSWPREVLRATMRMRT